MKVYLMAGDRKIKGQCVELDAYADFRYKNEFKNRNAISFPEHLDAAVWIDGVACEIEQQLRCFPQGKRIKLSSGMTVKFPKGELVVSNKNMLKIRASEEEE